MEDYPNETAEVWFYDLREPWPYRGFVPASALPCKGEYSEIMADWPVGSPNVAKVADGAFDSMPGLFESLPWPLERIDCFQNPSEPHVSYWRRTDL